MVHNRLKRSQSAIYPYFKLQYYDPRNLAWKDLQRRAFRTPEDLRVYLRKSPTGNFRLRVMVFEERSQKPISIEELINA